MKNWRVGNKAMRYSEIYAITCYAEFRNSDCQKSNGNKFDFQKPGITRKFNGNFTRITHWVTRL